MKYLSYNNTAERNSNNNLCFEHWTISLGVTREIGNNVDKNNDIKKLVWKNFVYKFTIYNLKKLLQI